MGCHGVAEVCGDTGYSWLIQAQMGIFDRLYS